MPNEEHYQQQHQLVLLVEQVDVVAGNALRWASLSSDEQASWSAYRTALLNVPQQDDFPLNVSWPTR